MKTKSFQKYLETRLNKEEIAEIRQQAQLEVKILRSLQQMITNSMTEYMDDENIGFNELVRRLDASPTHVAKIQRGEANLTLSSLAHLLALMGKEPKDIFRSRK